MFARAGIFYAEISRETEGELPMIVSIECAEVETGACLSWWSPCPEEDEVLMPPRRFLEVAGPPWLIRADDGGLVYSHIQTMYAFKHTYGLASSPGCMAHAPSPGCMACETSRCQP